MNDMATQAATQAAEAVRTAVPRFVAVDGMRAWMAWLVVLSHVVEQALPGAVGQRWIAFDLGGQAVYTFIIISGFVITHLLVVRPDTYLAYLIPRYMRLFPALLVCCLIGTASYAVAANWADREWFDAVHGRGYRALVENWPYHVAAHLAMLHGLIPNTVLDYSQYAFVPPAWSVSLEWQFYLVAPIVVWLCRRRGAAMGLVAVTVILSVLYHMLSDLWDRPSFLPGASKWFLIGIACRYAAPVLAGRVRYVGAIGLGLGFTMLWLGTPALAGWLVVYSFMLRADDGEHGIERLYSRTMKAIFESRPILSLAERSYLTYLLHWPIITLIGALATASGVASGHTLLATMLLAFPLTLIVQEPIYRWIEVPGRSLGKRWAAKVRASAERRHGDGHS